MKLTQTGEYEKSRASNDWRFCVAPMMDWTDRHCRFLHRLLSRRARLYTEMLTTGAVIHGDRRRLLGFSQEEHPIALQLGGSISRELAEAAAIGEAFGYDEINLNVGCPSDRVQNGAFGACLMRTPALVAECVAAMKNAVNVPVTVKCRIGVDAQEPRDALWTLTKAVVDAGADALIAHARKAWLEGLSPKENRDVPPLDYPLVHRLKQDFPHLPIVINGGISSLPQGLAELGHVDGIMLGRAAYHNTSLLLQVDPLFFGEAAPFADVAAAVESMLPYVEAWLVAGGRLADITRHMLGLFAGEPGARAYRRHLASFGVARGAGPDVIRGALAHLGRRSAALPDDAIVAGKAA